MIKVSANLLGKSPLGDCQDLVCGDAEDLDSLWDLDGLKLEFGVEYSDRAIQLALNFEHLWKFGMIK